MRKLFITFCFISTSVIFTQSKTDKSIFKQSKVSSISYIADKTEELETIDWRSIKEVFKNNKEDEIIELTFGVNFKKSKSKFKSSIKISGETKDLDSLILKSKKGVQSLISISKKYKQ